MYFFKRACNFPQQTQKGLLWLKVKFTWANLEILQLKDNIPNSKYTFPNTSISQMFCCETIFSQNFLTNNQNALANNEWQISGMRMPWNTCQVPGQEQELRWPLTHIHGRQCNKRPQDSLHRHFLPHCWRFWLVQCLANRHKFRKISGKSWNSAVHRGTGRLFLTCCNLIGCSSTLLQPCPQVQSSLLSKVTNVAKCEVGNSWGGVGYLLSGKNPLSIIWRVPLVI